MNNNTETTNAQEKLQKVLVEILQYFVSVCEEHNLQYFVTYGTLIGAVRHKGFIPWDDDIDVAMPRDDYNRFLEIMDGKKGKYAIIYPTKENNYYLSFIKLYDTTTLMVEYRDIDCSYGIYIDVFPIDGTVQDKRKQQALFQKFVVLKNQFHICSKTSVSHIKDACLKLLKFKLRTVWYELFYGVFRRKGREVLLKKMNDLMTSCPYNTAEYVVCYPGSADIKEIIKKEWINETQEGWFEGLKVKIPIDYDSFLKHIYGDYMELPPEEERVSCHARIEVKYNIEV